MSRLKSPTTSGGMRLRHPSYRSSFVPKDTAVVPPPIHAFHIIRVLWVGKEHCVEHAVKGLNKTLLVAIVYQKMTPVTCQCL